MADDEFVMRRTMERAAQAQTAIENPILAEIFTDLEEIYKNAWRASEPRDTDGRERAWVHLRSLDTLKKHLEIVAAQGRMASRQIERDFRNPKRFGIV